MTIVRDIPDSHTFVDDSMSVEHINQEFGTDYDSFFIDISDGDYISVFGIYGIVPYLNKQTYKVL